MPNSTLAARQFEATRSDVTDVLSTEQKEHKNILDRFHINIKALQYMLRHELQAISARFEVKNAVASLDPIDIGYFERDLQHVTIEKRRSIEFAECRYHTESNTEIELTVIQFLECLCDDGLTVENFRINNGVGLLHLDLKRVKAYVRVMSADFKPSADVPYPFLIVTE